MPEFQIQRDGETVTIDTDWLTPDALPSGFSLNGPNGAADGFISRTHHDAQVKRAKTEAAKGKVSIEDAAADESVVSAVLAQHKPEGKDFDVEAFKTRLTDEQVKPLQEKVSGLIAKNKLGEIMQAAAEVGVDPKHLKGGEKSYLAYLVADQLEYDDEHGFVATENGQRLPGGEGRAFAGAKDLLQRMKQAGDHGGLFTGSAPQGGGGSFNGGSGGSNGSGKVWSREEIGKMSPDEYAKHATDINKALAEGRVK